MLIITRDPGQQLTIQAGEHTITITVLENTGRQARLGIDAPKEFQVLRDNAKVREPRVVRQIVMDAPRARWS